MPLQSKSFLQTLLFSSLLIVFAASANAQTPDGAENDKADAEVSTSLPAITVDGRSYSLLEESSSASEGVVGREQFQQRPLLRTGELLEVVPGMVVTQHSGNGKANQFFFRGFNLDHGTDFRTVVDGMPVNMRSHGHGQGYTDINFLIPELVDRVEYKKGIYYAENGDFSSAGSAEFKLAKFLDKGEAKLTVGEDGFYRGFIADSAELGAGTFLLGAELFFFDGPWEQPDDARKFSSMGRYTWSNDAGEFSILALAYNNDWNSTDQIAQRAVTNNLISELGNLDPDLGGRTNRYSLSLNWEDESSSASIYGLYYDLNLYSNFTYFLNDPVNGDEFEQVDRRFVLGGNYESQEEFEVLGNSQLMTYGLDWRSDFIGEVGLYNTAGRERLSTVRQDQVRQNSLGLYVKHETQVAEKVRTELGLRGDLFWFDVEADVSGNSGDEFDSILSPKVNVVFGPWYDTELYVNAGYGFHSNDARGVVISEDPASGEAIDAVDPLVRSKGFEFGLRTEAVENLHTTLAFWALELDSELVFVGDAGNTEASAKSKRLGVELTNFYRLTPLITLDLDYAFSRARFAEDTEEGDRVPGAMEHVVTGGVTFDSAALDPLSKSSYFGALRLRYFAPFPLIEDNSVRSDGSALANLRAGYRYSDFSLAVEVLNLFDSGDHDIDYFYESRLPNQASAGVGEASDGVSDVHFHPLQPRQFRATLAYRF